MDFDRLCDEVLSLIEYDETSLLNWGFANVELDLDRHLSTMLGRLRSPWSEIWQQFEDQGKAVDDIIERMLARKLVFRIETGNYRSRFAETMRLLLLLRQRFDFSDWATAPRLIGDARIQLQRRRYPRRDVTSAEAEAQLADLKLTKDQIHYLRTLTQGADGKALPLAAFQVRAIKTLLKQLNRRGEYGVVVGAGTGSGKTKAFYIPALLWLAGHRPANPTVSIIAIYPRNELLKDQFAEAVRETSRLNRVLIKQGKRPISLGAYYGDTPRNETEKFAMRDTEDWIAPYYRCPECDTGLVWRVSDRLAKQYVLRCQKCAYESDPSHVLITRAQMKEDPPDILFTTTEMLNRRLSRVDEAAVFGIRAQPPPRMLLLDELHTYEGISGANVAYLIRRWRKACGYSQGPASQGNSLCVVGLSATLNQPVETLGKLTGLYPRNIEYVSPEDEEFEEQGIEYNVALKSDATAGTSTLSAAIQIAMLMGRMLDPMGSGERTFPPRIFAFTNKLDILNRWHDDQKDAEDRHLARFRRWKDQQLPDSVRQSIRELGQDWSAAELIGANLEQALRLTRTSSQKRGVDPAAKLVLATSALEVGFNDHTVGAVMQYQAPYTMASFLQRKGRAGRDRMTRPWTIVIASAYGRDRWMFQNTEALFDPLLKPIQLPVENYYVRKIQAAFVLMDWLAVQLHREFPRLDLWALLQPSPNSRETSKLRNAVVAALSRLLTENASRVTFESWLREALGLRGEEHDSIVQSLLWAEPRPILMEVVPTLIRQLQTGWQEVESDAKGRVNLRAIDPNPADKAPMPDFVPGTLFTDLNLPELRLWLGDKLQLEPFVRTFEEILPGKVTKRYPPHGRQGSNGWWIAMPLDPPDTCPIEQLPIALDQVPFSMETNGTVYTVRRPVELRLTPVPEEVSAGSTAWPIWHSELTPKSLLGGEANSLALEMPHDSSWSPLIRTMEVYSQSIGSVIQVKRALTGLRLRWLVKRKRIQKRIDFTSGSRDEGDKSIAQPAAIGYSLDVDGLRVCCNELDLDRLKASPEWDAILRSARPLLFQYALEQNAVVNSRNLTTFEIDWISQITRAALTATAVSTGKTLVEASDVFAANPMKLVNRTLVALFQVQDDDSEHGGGRLKESLQDRFHDGELRDAILKCARVLWANEPDGLNEWLKKQYASSLASAFLVALSGLVPDIDVDDLLLDVDERRGEFWITETTPGGVGLITRIFEAMAQYPRSLELRLLDTIQYCSREKLGHEMRAVMETDSPEVKEAFGSVRNRRDFVGLSEARNQLAEALEHINLPATRSLIVALNAKFLRPNSDEDTDLLVRELIDLWDREERRLGCVIDLRVFAVAVTRLPLIREQLDSILKRIGGETTVLDNQRFNLLQSLLWIRCHDSCDDCIRVSPRYQTLVQPSRHLIQVLLNHGNRKVEFGADQWRETLETTLGMEYQCAVCCPASDLLDLKQDLIDILTTPIEVGVQHFFPVVERIERVDHGWAIHLIIREMLGYST